MKLLITADLHLVGEWRNNVLDGIGSIWRQAGADMLVIAGDIAIATEAEHAFESLRKIVPDKPISVILGNHDLWVGQRFRDQGANFEDVLECFWQPAAEHFGVHLLDLENMPVAPHFELVGAYGHYDLGFAVPGLVWDGVLVEAEHYLSGQPPRADRVVWNDFRFLACERGLLAEAERQAALLDGRLSEAEKREHRTLVIVHTPPFEEMMGGNRDKPTDPRFAFARAYVGNSLTGNVIKKHASRMALLACGHTHIGVGPESVNGLLTVNIGSDYGRPRGLLYDTDTSEGRRLDVVVQP